MNPDTLLIYNFNLAALLKLSDLNLRDTANYNMKLTVGEYFKMLSEFIDLAPDVSDALQKFADDDSGNKDWKSIKDISALLNKIGSHKYINDLDAIRTAHGKGNHKLAASHAGKILQGFNDLYTHVMSAKVTKNTDNIPAPGAFLFSCLKDLQEEETDRMPMVFAVDDSQAILEAVSAVLSNEYNVFKLPKPTMLEDVLKKVKPDLFLLDYQMPEMNGFELIPIIRRFKELKETPIIFLTSEGTVDNFTAAIGLGACDFIVKPFHPEQLREKVAKHIVKR